MIGIFKVGKIELTPLAVKKIDSMKTEDNNPPWGLSFMSSKISLKIECQQEVVVL